MNILAVQGSPRLKDSVIETLLQEFLRGAKSQGAEAETIYLEAEKIHSCIGCYVCWKETPGVCTFRDDMPKILEKVQKCDMLVFATPLYHYNMTALLQSFTERLRPLFSPLMVKKEGRYQHPLRNELNRKMIWISTSELPEVSAFEGIRGIFQKMEENGPYSFVGQLLIPASDLLSQEELREKFQGVLQGVFQAGVEAIRDGKVSKETEGQIYKLFLSADEIARINNRWWNQLIEENKKIPLTEKIEDVHLFLKRMVTTFNAQAAGDLQAKIQYEFRGNQKGEWFLSIGSGKCYLHEGKLDSPTLSIKIPSEVLLAIANKEMDEEQALREGNFQVEGDLDLQGRMKNLFGVLG